MAETDEMAISKAIARIEALQCELNRLRWAPEFDVKREREILIEMHELATPQVILEVRKRMGIIEDVRRLVTPKNRRRK